MPPQGIISAYPCLEHVNSSQVDDSNNQSRILRSSDDGKDENIIKVGRGVALGHNRS